jgi:hypothetical protein
VIGHIIQMTCPYSGILVVLTSEGRVYYTTLKAKWDDLGCMYEPAWRELTGPLDDALASLKEKAP